MPFDFTCPTGPVNCKPKKRALMVFVSYPKIAIENHCMIVGRVDENKLAAQIARFMIKTFVNSGIIICFNIN